MDKQNFRLLHKKIMERIARLVGTLSAPARLDLVRILSQGPHSVENLSQMTGFSVANTSQHLQKMAREGLVEAERDGVSRFYKLRTLALIPVLESLQDLAHVLDPWMDQAEAEMVGGSSKSQLTIDEIKLAIRKGEAQLLDVRTDSESRSTPIPGAIHISHLRLKLETRKLSKKKPIYVICRGRYCPTATEAVALLQQRGFRAHQLPKSSYSAIRALLK